MAALSRVFLDMGPLWQGHIWTLDRRAEGPTEDTKSPKTIIGVSRKPRIGLSWWAWSTFKFLRPFRPLDATLPSFGKRAASKSIIGGAFCDMVASNSTNWEPIWRQGGFEFNCFGRSWRQGGLEFDHSGGIARQSALEFDGLGALGGQNGCFGGPEEEKRTPKTFQGGVWS